MEEEQKLPIYLQGIPEIPQDDLEMLRVVSPMGDRILVLPCDPEKKSRGGIIIPDTAQERAFRGIIVAKGPGVKLDNGEHDRIQAEVGDIIIYGKYSGSEWNPFASVNPYLIMRETDIALKLGHMDINLGTI